MKYSRSNVFRAVGSGNMANVVMKFRSARSDNTLDLIEGSKWAVTISKLDNEPANGCKRDDINFCCIAAFFDGSVALGV